MHYGRSLNLSISKFPHLKMCPESLILLHSKGRTWFPFPSLWASLDDSISMRRIWQKWLTSMTRSKKHVASWEPVPRWLALGEADCEDVIIPKKPYREVYMTSNWSLCPKVMWEHHLGSRFSSLNKVFRWLQPKNILTATLWDPTLGHLSKLFLNSWPSETERINVVLVRGKTCHSYCKN